MFTGPERRRHLEGLVRAALDSESDGYLTALGESAALDFKEEAGRRSRTGELEPGRAENPAAATKLADEVACFANSPGGGVLVLGVDGRTGEVVGTELNAEWLRHRIYRAVDVAPDVQEQAVAGQRLLTLYVGEAVEPVENSHGALRWRVGDHCVPVDRAAWWEHRRERHGADPMAEPSTAGVGDVPRSTVERVRRLLAADQTETDAALLHRIGAAGTDGRLTQAARIVLVPPGRPLIELTILDVQGGDVLNRVIPEPTLPLIEQLDRIEQACDLLNSGITLGDSFAHEVVRRVPPLAVRESLLNGIIHRDWNSREPTEVRWIEADSCLLTRSPGGFTGGVTQDNVLTHRHPRHPALADLFRTVGLVEKQGLGVDRMYTAMISLGHRPPRVVETPGPHVECELVGGTPYAPVMSLIRHIRPESRQRDVRIVLLVDALLHTPFLTDEMAARILQTDELSARAAFEAATQTTVAATPLLRRYKDVWVFGKASFAYGVRALDVRRAVPVMAHASSDELVSTVDAWLSHHETITTADLMELSGVSRSTCQRVLGELEGRRLHRVGAGRSTRFARRW